jgi:hypothetical protein
MKMILFSVSFPTDVPASPIQSYYFEPYDSFNPLQFYENV